MTLHTKQSRIALAALLSASLLLGLAACAADPTGQTTVPTGGPTAGQTSGNPDTTGSYAPVSVVYDSADIDDTWSSTQSTAVSLCDQGIVIDGTGVSSEGGVVTVSAAGTYVFAGSLTEGRIVVDTTDKELVRLILNGADLTSSEGAVLQINQADKVILILAEGSSNTLTDNRPAPTDSAVTEADEADGADTSDEASAVLYSKEDLTITGAGRLTINANYRHGINGKDELKITGGILTITAVEDGIRGRDCVAILDGALTITAGEDGIRSSNDSDAALGFVAISGGQIQITAGRDGIQAVTSVSISGGRVSITAGGGSKAAQTTAPTQGRQMGGGMVTSDSVSTKGIKVTRHLSISGGQIEIDAADDAIHSNDTIRIDGGTLTLRSGDDGIHADTSIIINDGDIRIEQSYEGIESAQITINGGTIYVVASDDAINVAGGADGSSLGGRPGQNTFNSNSNRALYINGGQIVVEAAGDGLDINGSITMTGGTVLINGPTASMNGAIDYDGSFKLTGGFIIAAGSVGMAQAPDNSSTQPVIMANFASVLPAGTLVHLSNQAGDVSLTFAPSKLYQSIVISTPDLAQGSTYLLYTGGQSSGASQDGLYSDGVYQGGTQVASLKLSAIITTYGTVSRQGGMPGRR